MEKVEREGAVTTKTYDDGRKGVVTHASEDAAKEYVDSHGVVAKLKAEVKPAAKAKPVAKAAKKSKK